MKPNNTKKKIVLGIVLVSAITVAGLQSAGAGPWGGGPDKWGGPHCGECDGSGYRGQQQLDDKSIEARDAFLSETVALRKEIATKKAEKQALMLGDNPDAKRVAQLTGELFDLREQLQKKAQEKGLGDDGFGRGLSRGCGGPGPRGFQDRL
jgi:zinc resistance-associated protein